MMRTVMVLTVFIVSFGILCGTVIITARHQPSPQWMTALRFDMCEPPCWIGIQPGKTTLDEALTRLQSTYPSPDYVIKAGAARLNSQKMLDIFVKGDYAVTVTFYVTGQHTVSAIDFYLAESGNFLGKSATYADIHGFLGVPSYLSIQSWQGDTLLSYPLSDGKVSAVSWGDRDNTKDRIRRDRDKTSLQYRSLSRLTFSKEEPLMYRGAVNLQWRGFLPLAKYRAMLCLESNCK